jgi:alkylation response protein AidB-like acyl-CoA dehydrogenase
MSALPDLAAGRCPAASSARQTWAELGAAGQIQAVYRDKDPRLGVTPDRLRALLGELDATTDTGVVLSVCVQLATALPLLAQAAPGSAALDAALSGSAVLALAATDAGPGTDLPALGTQVQERPEGVLLTGTKRWITNAAAADWILVLARRRPGPHFTNFSWVLVPADAVGVRVEAADTALFTGAELGHVYMTDVILSRQAVIGGAGRGMALFARHIAVERLAGAMWASAMCHRALDQTRRRLQRQGGAWNQEDVRERYARALLLARQHDALLSVIGPRIAEYHDQAAGALLKASAGTTAEKVIAECAYLHGAEGFLSDGLQRLRAEAAMFSVAGGSTGLMLSAVADSADIMLREMDPRAGTR